MSAHADLSFDGHNRFVMKGKRLPITLVNEGKEPALAEISLDWGTDGKGQALPFAVSRPLLRLGAGQRAKVEVLYQGQGLPTDRETYLLLSVAGRAARDWQRRCSANRSAPSFQTVLPTILESYRRASHGWLNLVLRS